jgi:hypothetical protein
MSDLIPPSPVRPWRASVVAALAAVLFLAAAPATARAQLTIDQLELQLDPGSVDRKVGVFSITNEGTEAVQVALHAEDWDRAESGENRFFPLGSQAHSCGEKLSIFPLSMRLEPGAVGQVRVSAAGLVPAARDLVVAFRNTGGSSLRTTGRVEFRRADNSVAAVATIAEFPTLPGARRNVAVALPTLAAGKYTALAMLDFGGSEIAAGQIDVDIP